MSLAQSPVPQQQAVEHGTVILHRNASDAPDTNTGAGVPAGKASMQSDTATADSPSVSNAEREAVRFETYDFDVRLTPREHGIAVRAQVRVSNGGTTPLPRLPLQLSSALRWESVRLGGRSLSFAQHTVRSDADHTGQLNEAVVTLPDALPPGARLDLDVVYEGAIPPSGERLEALGTPPGAALATDWDGITADFTGLRGFGNVVWYPVSSAPVALGEGNRFFAAIGRERLRGLSTYVTEKVTEEVYGALPTIAVADGTVLPLHTISTSSDASLPSIVTCTLPRTQLGFRTPSLFLAVRTEQSGNFLNLFARERNVGATLGYMTASSMVTPLVREWLGVRPQGDLTVLDLPEGDDGPAQDGRLVLLGIQDVDPKALATPLSQALPYAFFSSPRPWLAEGVPSFLGSLWTERESGREAALAQLESGREALALADPGPESGQSLEAAHDPIFYRTKATYVLWMLREIVGTDALAATLRAYRPEEDVKDRYFQKLLEEKSGKPLEWFFNDWVGRDRGLPDLSIVSVFSAPGSGGTSFIVTVTVANAGFAAAEVPLVVTSPGGIITERLLIPGQSTVVRRVLVQGKPTSVQLNDGIVPEQLASVHRKLLQPMSP